MNPDPSPNPNPNRNNPNNNLIIIRYVRIGCAKALGLSAQDFKVISYSEE